MNTSRFITATARLCIQLLGISYIFLLCSCSASRVLKKEIGKRYKSIQYSKEPINIDSLVTGLNALSARDREKIIVPLMLGGNIPAFNLLFKKVKISYRDSSGKKFNALLFVSPDYLSIGNNGRFMRMPLSPQAAQQIADSLHAVLPTKKIADEIYMNAAIKLEPQPLSVQRDSFITFLQHHNIIQQQLGLNDPSKLIAGIKKDVVQSPKIYTASKPNRVAIYGWHQLNGKPIQPLYTGHVDWYVDYSHGIRLVYEKMLINGKPCFVKDVLNDPSLQKIICDEVNCAYIRYKD